MLKLPVYSHESMEETLSQIIEQHQFFNQHTPNYTTCNQSTSNHTQIQSLLLRELKQLAWNSTPKHHKSILVIAASINPWCLHFSSTAEAQNDAQIPFQPPNTKMLRFTRELKLQWRTETKTVGRYESEKKKKDWNIISEIMGLGDILS